MGTPPFEHPSLKPTRVRFVVLTFICTLSLLTYLDRVCIMRVSKTMSTDLHLDADGIQMGWVFSAFLCGYALMEVPGGWMGDRWGARRVLTRIVLWWSAFTALTGCVVYFTVPDTAQVFLLGYPLIGSFGLLVLVRFLFGAGEAGAYPNITRVTGVWFPLRERGLAQGTVWMTARLGGAVAPTVMGFLATTFGWRVAFWILGCLGLVWAAAFRRWFRDRASDMPACNAAERELILSGQDRPNSAVRPDAITTPADTRVLAQADSPVVAAEADEPVASDHAWPAPGLLLRNASVWGMAVAAFAVCFGWYFYPTWQAKYLDDVFHISYADSEILTGLPFLFGAAGALLGGVLSDWLVYRTGSRRLGRSLVGIVGFTGAGVCVFLTGFATKPWHAVTLLCLAFFINDLAIPTLWASFADVGGRFVGTLSGLMNMIGAIGGMIGPVLTPIVLKKLDHLPTGERWQYVFAGMAVAWFIAAAAWLFIDAGKSLSADH